MAKEEIKAEVKVLIAQVKQILMLVPVVKMFIVQERKNMEDTNLDLGVDFRFYGLMV